LTFASIVESAFDEIARYGRSSVSVTCRLLEAVRSVGSCVQREADRRALLRQATAIAGELREAQIVRERAIGIVLSRSINHSQTHFSGSPRSDS
jgi:uncharacterized membrane protein